MTFWQGTKLILPVCVAAIEVQRRWCVPALIGKVLRPLLLSFPLAKKSFD